VATAHLDAYEIAALNAPTLSLTPSPLAPNSVTSTESACAAHEPGKTGF